MVKDSMQSHCGTHKLCKSFQDVKTQFYCLAARALNRCIIQRWSSRLNPAITSNILQMRETWENESAFFNRISGHIADSEMKLQFQFSVHGSQFRMTVCTRLTMVQYSVCNIRAPRSHIRETNSLISITALK